MIQTLVFVGIVSLLAAIVGALIALQAQRSYFKRLEAQQRGWERAQEGHQNTWAIKQKNHFAELEARLSQQVQQVQQSWNEWAIRDEQRLQALTKQHADTIAQMRIQSELARLPRIEEVPVRQANAPHTHDIPTNWQAPQLQASDLSGYDLSHRYLAHADLRDAQLVNTNFFMADLSGATLINANLAGADLSGANLTNADLRGATLTGANLLVADLQGTLLLGAKLLETRNLTKQQLSAAIYDDTTQLDTEYNDTRPHVEKVPSTPATGNEETQKIPVIPSTDRTNGLAVSRLPETPRPTLASDEELISLDQQEMLPPSSIPASSDSQLDLKATNPLIDRQENTHTEAFDTTLPKPGYNGKR